MTSRLRPGLAAALLVGIALAPTAAAAGRTQDRTWHGTQIKMYDAQSAGRSGRGVVVAVLDGWIDRSHPDFEGRALQGAQCQDSGCTAGEGANDHCGKDHGTHVAGTVASSSFGVAPKATLLPVRVLRNDGNGGCTASTATVAAGIRWAVRQGARVLNLSLGPDVPGLGSSSEIPTAVSEAADAGVVVVFSAGNADLPVAQAYGSDALVVAATGPSGALATYSQHGQGVSVAAPGGQPDSSGGCSQSSCVTSLYPNDQYAVAAGTSMAAPHVSGIAVLLLGQQPGRSRQNVMDRITGTAHPLADAGAGLVDARAALAVRTTAPRPTATRATPRPVVRPHPVRPAPKPVSRPAGTHPPVPRATVSPTASSPSGTAPAATPYPSTSPAAEPQALRLGRTADEVPVPVGALAGVLAALAGAGVVAVSRRPRTTVSPE